MTQNRKSDRVAGREGGKVVNKAFEIEALGGILFIYLAQLVLVNLCSNGYRATGYTELRYANTWINKLDDVKSKKCIFYYYYLISKQKSYKCCQSTLQMGVFRHSVGKLFTVKSTVNRNVNINI